jgi:hypothetical protein
MDVLVGYELYGLIGAALENREEQNTFVAALQGRFRVEEGFRSPAILIRVAHKGDVYSTSRAELTERVCEDSARALLFSLVRELASLGHVQAELVDYVGAGEEEVQQKLNDIIGVGGN